MLLPFDRQALTAPVEELDRWRSRLDFRGPLRRAWAGRLRRDLEAEAVAASTSMEGVPVTLEDVHRILAGDRPPETPPRDAALVRGYREAMTFVLRRADDPAFRWDRELLVGLHDRVLAGNWGAGAGRMRTGPAYVVDAHSGALVFQPPPAEEVPALVDRACAALEQGHEHPALQAAWIHVALAAIHPFRDGNGRVSRVASSLAMYRGGFRLPEFTSLEEWWGRHLAGYYAAFGCLGAAFDPGADVTAFVLAHVEAQLRQVRALDLRERVQQRIWTAVEEAVAAAGLAPRLANAAWDAFFGRPVTPRYYRALADVSPVTASTDLRGAAAAFLLKAEGRARSRVYVAGDALHRTLAAALGVAAEGKGEPARAAIVGELTRREAARGLDPGAPFRV